MLPGLDWIRFGPDSSWTIALQDMVVVVVACCHRAEFDRRRQGFQKRRVEPWGVGSVALVPPENSRGQRFRFAPPVECPSSPVIHRIPVLEPAGSTEWSHHGSSLEGDRRSSYLLVLVIDCWNDKGSFPDSFHPITTTTIDTTARPLSFGISLAQVPANSTTTIRATTVDSQLLE
jgi:hypothetical protein